MRTKDETKKQRIIDCLLRIVKEEGINNFSIDKLAKYADVSAGTPYVYFKDKQDMLAKIYNDIINDALNGLEENIAKGNTFEEKLLIVCNHYNKINIENPYESSFVYLIETNNLLENHELSLKIAAPIKNLLQDAIDADAVKIKDINKLYSMLFAPRRLILKNAFIFGEEVDKEKLEFVCKQSVRTILKGVRQN